MEDQIRRAIADRDFARAQTLADDWLTRAQDVAVAHYFAAWCRDAQELEADAVVHYEKADAIAILLKLVADTATDVHIKRYDRALRFYGANPDGE